MKVCRYNKDANPSTCGGCEYGCLDHKPAAYINRDFEEAVGRMTGQEAMKQNNTRFHVLRIRAAELKQQGLEVEEIAERLDIPKMIAMAMLEKGAENVQV